MTLAAPTPVRIRRADDTRAHALYCAGVALARARLAYVAGRTSQGAHQLYAAGAHLGEVRPLGDPMLDAGLWRLRMTVLGPRLHAGMSRHSIERHFAQLQLLIDSQLRMSD